MKKISALQVLLATLGIAIGGSAVVYGAANLYSMIYGNGYTNPATTMAGSLAADGGIPINVTSTPSALQQTLQITSLSPMAAQWRNIPDGGVTGAGTQGYIPEWDSTNHLTNSTLWESGAYVYRQLVGGNLWGLYSYSATSSVTALRLMRSHSSTLGTLATTQDGDLLGSVQFLGANSTSAYFTYGAQISVLQYGTAGVNYVPAKLSLYTYSSSAANLQQFVLWPDNSVSMSGPVSAANLPYCKAGQVHIGGTGTATGTATATVTSRTCQNPPWTNTPLSDSVPPLVAAGPGVAGTGTSAQRSDSQQGLSATNPNKGDFFRSPTGTDTATNTNTTWDHALDLVRYAGSGTADPTAGAGVPCLLPLASPLSMCLYYQTVHCNDGGCTYAIWWKSGSGDTQWTQFGTGGGGGGGGTIVLTSPLGTINIGSGGGLTTEDVVFGHAVHTALQGSEWNAASGVAPLDPNTMVPLSNLYPSTESHAGTMSAADKIILDNMVSDTYEVKAAVGTTPGYLAAVCESTDSSITIGQTGDYVTFAANIGTGTSQVCSGSTCAGLQSQLPACAPGKIEQFGTVSQTGTDTNTTTSRSCQNLPSYVAPAPVSTVHNIATATSSSTLTALATAVLGDNAQATIPPATYHSYGVVQTVRFPLIPAAAATAETTATSVLPGDAKVARSTNRNISTTTATTTASSTATDLVGSDAQVVLPVASASQQGIAKVASNAVISTSTNTGTATASSTAGATCMPADAKANGDHKVLAMAADYHAPGYLCDKLSVSSPLVKSSCEVDDSFVYLSVSAATTAARGAIQLDPNAPPALDGGPAVTGSRGLAADSGNKPKLGGNSPTPGDVLMGVSDTTTATATNTSTSTVSNLKFGKLPESSVAGLTTDLSTRPTGTGLVSGCLLKAGSSSSVACGIGADNGSTVTISGNIAANNLGPKLLRDTIFTATNASFALLPLTAYIDLYGRAGGGQGGGAQVTYNSYMAVGGGGAQGGSVQTWVTSIASPISVTVGAGGSGSNCTGGGVGTSGGATFITINGVTYTAVGGGGGAGMYSTGVVQAFAMGGRGFNTTPGTVNLGGANGLPGQVLHNNTDPVMAYSGAGGGEGGGPTSTSAGNYAAQGPGGGGGGAYAGSLSTTCVDGGAGGNGWARIREYAQ